MDLKQVDIDQRVNASKNDFFDSTYNRVYSDLLNIELADQLSFLRKTYLEKKLKSELSILDLCCGTGRHLLPLNKDGYKVDGVDINKEYVSVASRKLDSISSGKVYVADAQNFSNSHRYNLIYSMESSIGYLPDKQTVQILKNLKQNLLTIDGIFVLHLINRDYLIKNLGERMWFGNERAGYVLECREFDSQKGAIQIEQIRIIDGISREFSVEMRLYSLQEIKVLLEQAGLQISQIYGNYNNGKFDISSPYMILECRLN